MKKPEIHIGCAGYNNSYWKGIFYPEGLPRSKWFGYYCMQFPMYEMNGTFYKFPSVKSLENTYNKTPENYRLTVKAPRVITHFKKFAGCQQEIADFYTACREGLKDKLDSALFQLPPSFHYTSERLEMITTSLSKDFKNVVEFRHASWWIPEVFEALAKNSIIFCSVSYPNLPEGVIKTSPIGYIRLHGRPKLFYSGYSDAELQQLYDDILVKGFSEVTVCFNNTASERGILDAMAMKKISKF
ncbi:MAG TPA: DUF72 domain-containing protein [Flavobacterium sp.]|nr:DUF72 domain-containing protein [Flavobacterium sp.]